MSSRRALVFGAICLALSVAGCSRYRVPEGEPALDADLRARVSSTLDTVWPASFRLVHRVSVSIVGRDVDLLGYLAVIRGKGLRAVAMGEMGGKFLDLLVTDHARILHKPGRLPERPILDGVARDLSVAFDPRPDLGEAVFVRLADGRIAVAGMHDGDGAVTVLTADGTRLLEMRRYSEGRLRSEILFDDWRVPGKGLAPVPYTVRVHNHRWRYEMTARIERWRGEEVESSVLEVQEAKR